MATVTLTSKADFSWLDFRLNIATDFISPTTEIEYLKKKIVVSGDGGCSVEFYGETLRPMAREGFVTSGVFKIDGVEVAEISDVNADISTDKWAVTAGFVSGFAPVSYVLDIGEIKDKTDEEFTFSGNRGDDTISGEGDAKNFLFGGAGDDLFFGNDAKTSFDGGKGQDRVSYFDADEDKPLTVSLADSSQNTGDAKGDVYNSIEDVTGGFGNDKLIGDKAANALNGGLGSDTLIGGAGRDSIDGGGKDARAFDFVSYEDAPETGGIGAYVSLADGIANAHGVAGETIRNIEGVIGSSFRDRLIGDGDTNTLNGEDGSDTLQGGRGTDILRGDAKGSAFSDADQFFYGRFNEGGDEIVDYDILDQIGISRSGFDLSDTFAIVDGVSFIKAKGAVATTDGPTFLFNTKSDNLLFDADGAGSGKAKMLAHVTFDNPDSLDASDVVLLF